MPGKFEKPRKKKKPIFLLPLLAVLILAAVLFFGKEGSAPTEPSQPLAEETTAVSTETTAAPTQSTAEPETVVATATISAQGDLLMHKGILTSCKQTDGSYDFSPIFQYLKDYTASYDYAIANLETTLGGPDYPYQGNPRFNCPDSLTAAVVDAGFDMLLTANNHSSDTYTDGILRTVEQVRAAGLETLGTQLSDDEPKYSIVEINGIKIGMLCYTYATNEYVEGRPSLNYKEFVEQTGLVNYFMESKLDRFYGEVEKHLADMKADGAEATVLYIHWGKEYSTTENSTQRTIAQKMCDLGIDVIVGGHPHVVQPMDLLQSNVDPDHRTVCIYSVGNAVSNQMKDEDVAFASGHSEDGALFTVSFEKYSDDSVYVTDVDVLPTWVNRHSNNGAREYNILPLDIGRESQWAQAFGLTDEQFAAAQESYDRTMDIIQEGLAECRTYLEEAKLAREQSS